MFISLNLIPKNIHSPCGDRVTAKVVNSADFPASNAPECISGKYYNLDKPNMDTPGVKSVEFAVEIPVAGIYYVFLRVKSPAAPGAEHDSCYITVDGERPQKVLFANAPCRVWVPVRFPNNKIEPGTALNMKPGKHSIKVYPRQTLLLDTVAVSPPGRLAICRQTRWLIFLHKLHAPSLSRGKKCLTR